MPLFKLMDLLDTRYYIKPSISEIHKLKEICKITEDSNERIVSLTPEVRRSPLPNIAKVRFFLLAVKSPIYFHFSFQTIALYCSVHCPNGIENRGWSDTDIIQPPNIMMSLKVFSSKLNDLLTSHGEAMSLLR